MMSKNVLLLLMLGLCAQQILIAQNPFTTSLYESYGAYKEASLDKRRIKHQQIDALVGQLRSNKKFQVQTVGHSIEGRPLSLISIGTGAIDVFLWSQMHGDEPTATQAIFDILNFLDSKDFKKEKETMLSQVKLHFLPMLNPDGAERFQRRNLLGIDINRDALRLQSPEGQALKRVRDSLDADFGFNLHDQSKYYNAARTDKPATISYLAPAYNYEKDINTVRANAMKVIVFMNSVIQKYAPGQVGRYNDDFEPRAFGDNIQKWGTSAILIESGGYANDPEKQEIRKLNYVSILSAIYTIATGSYATVDLAQYEDIPENDRKMFDLKLEGLTYPLLDREYLLDLGINHYEIDDPTHSQFKLRATVADQGDLSTFYGYETLNAKGLTAERGKVYPEVFDSYSGLGQLDVLSLLRQGFLYLQVKERPENALDVALPFVLVPPGYSSNRLSLNPGVSPNFVLTKAGKVEYAIVNGFLIRVQDGQGLTQMGNSYSVD